MNGYGMPMNTNYDQVITLRSKYSLSLVCSFLEIHGLIVQTAIVLFKLKFVLHVFSLRIYQILFIT